jgi:hypothetical protein
MGAIIHRCQNPYTCGIVGKKTDLEIGINARRDFWTYRVIE